MQSVLFAVRSLTLSQRLLIFTLTYAAVASSSFPVRFTLVFGPHPVLRFVVFTGTIFLAGLLATTLIHHPASPFAFMRQRVAERGAGALAIIGTLVVSSAAFSTLKFEYTKMVPFFADPALAAIDRAIHSDDPWRWLRGIFPEMLDYPLFILYSGVWFTEVIAGVAIAAFVTDRGLRERYLASFAIGVIVLSSVVRVFANSGGPIFYDRMQGGTTFADLTAALAASPSGASVLQISDYLYQSYATSTSEFGTGISAMPSLHVALAFLNALFFARLGRVTGWLGWGFFAAVLFGSVYFGWHYAVDGYVSMAVMLGFWKLFARAEREAGA